MNMRDLVGKRCLLRLEPGNRYTEHQIVDEYKVLEVSPSGNFTKLQSLYGQKFWRLVSSVAFIEQLADLQATPSPKEPAP